VYQPLELGGDIQLLMLSAYVGIHFGRMQVAAPGHEGHTPLVHGITAMQDDMQAHRNLLFTDTYDVVCLQSLYQFSHFDMVDLCMAIKTKWCGEGEACDRFVQYCTTHGRCGP
jgi:hypothetical protein